MTVDDLVKIYHEAASNVAFLQYEGPDHRAGVTSIVRALRDEFSRIMDPGDDWNRMGVVDVFNEILGDAGEKVAGGSTSDASKAIGEGGALSVPGTPTPATDAAPAVCVWTLDTHPDDGSHYETACGDAWCSVLGGTPKQDNYSFCPSCGKPITFTEANHG